MIPATAIDGLTYAGLSCALIAAINLLMSRIAPQVATFGLAAVIVGQLPLPLVLSTLLWTTKGTRTVQITGAVLAVIAAWRQRIPLANAAATVSRSQPSRPLGYRSPLTDYQPLTSAASEDAP